MEGNSEEVVSTQKTLQSSHDPGWNDPPNWAFSPPQKPAGTPTKRLLNKRVAFPLNSKQETSSAPLNPSLSLTGIVPPSAEVGSLTTAPHKPIVAPTGAILEDLSSEIEINKEQALIDTLDNLRIVMEQVESSKVEEIKKRLDRMEAMWKEDKLNSAVYTKILQLSEALKAGNVETADQLHITLMMNNATVCSLWIPGIRQLIAEIKNKKM